MRRNPPAKWVLPQVIDPQDYVCYLVRVPKERFHIGAFLGAFQILGSAMSWQDDPQHKARLVAKVWRRIADSLQGQICDDVCPPSPIGKVFSLGDTMGLFRQNGCKLEFSPDGECWCVIYDPTDCILTEGGQPDGDQSLPAGTCRTYNVSLAGNGKWLLPVKVDTGDTIEVTEMSGAWSNTPFQWKCPNGQPYILGLCVGGTFTDGGNPLPASPTMGLIALYETGGGGFAGGGATLLVPTGKSGEQVEFQANDDDLTDNAGHVSFKVTVCKKAATVDCKAFTFTDLADQQIQDLGGGRYIIQANASNSTNGDWSISFGFSASGAGPADCCPLVTVNSLQYVKPTVNVYALITTDCGGTNTNYESNTNPDVQALITGQCWKALFIRSDTQVIIDFTITDCP